MRIESDFIVIGSGIAGLSFALKAAKLGKVSLIAKSTIDDGATQWAQGGIAAVFSESDSFESHIEDTLDAGDGLCDRRIVEITVREGPARVRDLIELGVPFTKSSSGNSGHNGAGEGPDAAFPFDLTKEGGHRARRILHSEDFTGRAIQESLREAVLKNPNIKVYEHHVAIDLITDATLQKQRAGVSAMSKQGARRRCFGAYVLDESKMAGPTTAGADDSHGPIHVFAAPFTVLATGGAGKVYRYSSNPDTATGDGIAMAYRAGARVANMEFMQFHPTCLYSPRAKSFLISEALRGEGGELINNLGEEFMKKHHPMGSLAPRDIVARAIDSEIKRLGAECVYLDMTRVVKAHGAEAVVKRFPNIYKKCLEFGIDFVTTPIPVVPAAHYTCGGILTDDYGESSIENLFAIGETASTGLHGANRLASNSLLEGVVFAHRTAARCEEKLQAGQKRGRGRSAELLPEWDFGKAVPLEERIDINHTWREIRDTMWNYVGIVRSNRRLLKARERLELIAHEVDEYYWQYFLNRDLIELRNLVTVANLVVQCAMLRKESRGLHYTLDYPERDDAFFKHDTVV